MRNKNFFITPPTGSDYCHGKLSNELKEAITAKAKELNTFFEEASKNRLLVKGVWTSRQNPYDATL
jgi:hypothetical protein